MSRKQEAPTLHDGEIVAPQGKCPKGMVDCWALSRVASEDYESFMCCGETTPESRSVPTDIFRLCIRSDHETGVDLMVNLDERDVIDTSSVLLGALSSNTNLKAMAAPEHGGG